MNKSLLKSPGWWIGVASAVALVFGDHAWQEQIGIPPAGQAVLKGLGMLMALLLASPAVKQLTEADRETLPPVPVVTAKGAAVPVEERTSLPPGES